ncbi:hypothetical protein RFI_02973 [Reticulomyxa filosa]|uniref:Uncharacterized protein n=1 Tax=Reticulomyxa filosa TaxID=46433 RepID=X6P901_RETFI|nr:hypothetical protein RFI_02973 [Reticulomyxa filosa]|eukprot:ETO34122.1 hypothetical protein RFI_02973 [Reticulomyxa filosa]
MIKSLTILNELKMLYIMMIFINKWDIHFNYIKFVQYYYIVENHVILNLVMIKYNFNILNDAILILHKHERREESEMELYCGLKNVRLENIKEIKSVAKIYTSDQGCILHFHPSMRRSLAIFSCDVSWISPFKHEREILFSRSHFSQFYNERIVQGSISRTKKLLFEFEEWRNHPNNKIKYEEKKKEFMERRCCNHHINLFSIFFNGSQIFKT